MNDRINYSTDYSTGYTTTETTFTRVQRDRLSDEELAQKVLNGPRIFVWEHLEQLASAYLGLLEEVEYAESCLDRALLRAQKPATKS
jgi:hypothetical protein